MFRSFSKGALSEPLASQRGHNHCQVKADISLSAYEHQQDPPKGFGEQGHLFLGSKGLKIRGTGDKGNFGEQRT